MPTSSAAVIAVVEDDADMRQAMRRVLETEGFVTETYSTAEDFLATGAAGRARCLVLDIQLPGASGIELHRQLRSSGIPLPTIFITAQEQRLLGLAMRGIDCCLVKPFAAESLVEAVNRSIQQGSQ